MSTLEEWTDAVCAELGIAKLVPRDAVVRTVLDLSRDVAHAVARPAAPITAYLLGVAAGRSADPAGQAAGLARQVADLAAAWPGSGAAAAGPGS